MSDRLPSQLARKFVDAAEEVAEALMGETRQRQETELGFEVETKIIELGEGLRGKYDVTRLERDHPQLVNLITWLLTLPGMTYQAIAEACGKGVCWETVAAIATSRREPIREFKLRQAAKLGLVLDAALGGLMVKAAAGKLTALDYKLLSDAWLQMSGEGHTMRFEGSKPEDPKRAALREILAGSSSRMVLEAEVIPQTGAAPVPLLPSVQTVQLNTSRHTGDS
jgi:hypothetical protein